MDNPSKPAILHHMDSDLIIVGGGLNGPALALAASQAGFTVTLIDALPIANRTQPGFDGRAYALALASVRLLRGIGVWDAIAPLAQPMLEIKVTDGRAGEGPAPWMMHFDHAEIEEGPMGHMIEDRHLRRAFLDALNAEPNCTHLAGVSVMELTVSDGQAEVTLSNGDMRRAQVLIGCDGRNSDVAKATGIKRIAWDYDQTAVVCAVSHEKPHNGIAHQFFMPNGPLAILPLTENRSSIVWSESRDRARALHAMDDISFLEALRPAFGSFLGDIALVGTRFCYPLGLSLAQSFVATRSALVGDAAHGVHPIAGQGLNAGLRDVAAMRDVIVDARACGEDIGSSLVLARYQQWRRFDTATLALATDTFNRVFSNDNGLLRTLRGVGMGLINSAPSLRRGFMREAAGLTGDLPTLMRG